MKKKFLLPLILIPFLLTGCGVKGDIGPTGPEGPQGIPGEKGDKGDTGVSITKVEKTSSEGNIDTYTITFSDGTSTTFNITNGENGHSPTISIGANGNWFIDNVDTGKSAKGVQGEPGNDGRSILTVIKTSSSGLVDTYTITYSDTTTSTFTVTNGKAGASILTGNGEPASTLGNNQDSYIDLDTWDYYLKENGTWSKKGNIKGEKGDPGKDGNIYISCSFVDLDGTKLCEKSVVKGSDISYDGPTPYLDGTSFYENGEKYTYDFVGWNKPLTNINEPTEFKARYTSKQYGCIFQVCNGENNNLYQTFVNKGDDAVYLGETPTSSIYPDWVFAGWDKSTSNIQENTVFTAVFEPKNKADKLEIKYVNYDGSLLAKEYIPYGGTPTSYIYQNMPEARRESTYDGNTKEVTEYSFKGWDAPLKACYVDTTFTAQYNVTTYTGYNVRFFDEDNTLIHSMFVKEGTPAVFPYPSPMTYDETTVTQLYKWDKDLSNVTSEINTHMITKTYPRNQNGEYPRSLVYEQDIINQLEDLEVGSDGYIHLDNEKYYKLATKTYGSKRVKAGVDVSWTTNAYFKVEPMRWKFLSDEGDGTYFVASEEVVDYGIWREIFGYNSSFVPVPNLSVYADSTIRNYFNSTMFSLMFGESNTSVLETTISNKCEDTSPADYIYDNSVYGGKTTDRLFPLSYLDYYNQDYGFITDSDRIAQCSDFVELLQINSGSTNSGLSYFTRTPTNAKQGDSTTDCTRVWRVKDGKIESNSLNYYYLGYRPACRLHINEIIQDNKTTIHLDANGGRVVTNGGYIYLNYNIPGVETKKVYTSINSPAPIYKNIPTKPSEGGKNYSFDGWYLDEELSIPLVNNDVNVIPFGSTLYAKWHELGTNESLFSGRYLYSSSTNTYIPIPKNVENFKLEFDQSLKKSSKDELTEHSFGVYGVSSGGEETCLFYEFRGETNWFPIEDFLTIDATKYDKIRIEVTLTVKRLFNCTVNISDIVYRNGSVKLDGNDSIVTANYSQDVPYIEVSNGDKEFVGWYDTINDRFIDMDSKWTYLDEELYLKAIWAD